MSDPIEVMARRIMLDEACGLTVNGKRVFCDDPTAPDEVRESVCECKIKARELRTALHNAGFQIEPVAVGALNDQDA